MVAFSRHFDEHIVKQTFRFDRKVKKVRLEISLRLVRMELPQSQHNFFVNSYFMWHDINAFK